MRRRSPRALPAVRCTARVGRMLVDSMPPPATIHVTRQPLDATQQGSLRTLFDSPSFSLLKEVVVARCIEKQVSAMSAALYPENEHAEEDAKRDSAQATLLNAVLDVLDDLAKKEQDWWTVSIEPRR